MKRFAGMLFLSFFLLFSVGCEESSSSPSSSPSEGVFKVGEAPPAPAIPTPDPDKDNDGLYDSDELILAQKYSPLLIFDEEENYCLDNIASRIAHPWQVTKVSEFPSGGGRQGIMITFVILYPRDCGAMGLDIDINTPWGENAHNGDTETIAMFYQDIGGGSARITKIMLHRHGDWYFYDQSEFGWSDQNTGGDRTHPIVYVSESKHAMFNYNCDDDWDVNWAWEDCGGGPKVTLSVASNQNVGERDHQLFDRLGNSGSGMLNLFSDEYAWSKVDFCGNRGGSACAGYMGKKWWPVEKGSDRRAILDFIFPDQSWHGWKNP